MKKFMTPTIGKRKRDDNGDDIEKNGEESSSSSSLLGESPNKLQRSFIAQRLGQEQYHPYDTSSEYKIMSWNVNGFNALMGKEQGKNLKDLVAQEQPLVLCLQETKLQDLASLTQQYSHILDGYTAYFNHCKTKKGYSGTAVYVRDDGPLRPIKVTRTLNGIEKHDGEGRVITVEFDSFYLINTYVPNSGQKLERLGYRTQEWDRDMLDYMKQLQEKKPVVWTGDLNCAILDIDIHDPKKNKRTAGFTDEERAEFRSMLDAGFVDTFRHFKPDQKAAYSYFGYRFNMREKNKGWRLDYFVTSESLRAQLVDSYIRSDVIGSDHVPIGLVIRNGKSSA